MLRDNPGLLRALPTTRHLARLYYEFGQLGARTVGTRAAWPYGRPDREALCGLAAEMSRHDPRLLEALVEFFGREWRAVCPLRLRTVMHRMRSPQVFGVVGAFARSLDRSDECGYYFDYLLRGWHPVAPQWFYQLHYALGSPRALRAATESVAEFRAWGFLAEQGPVLRQADKRAAGTYATVARRNIRSRLLAARETITLKDYLVAVHHAISRQQAYLDLKGDPRLRQNGHGRGSRWRRA